MLILFFSGEEMIANPFETRSDSFYFVDDRLIMHNKADYAYNGGLQPWNAHVARICTLGTFQKKWMPHSDTSDFEPHQWLNQKFNLNEMRWYINGSVEGQTIFLYQ